MPSHTRLDAAIIEAKRGSHPGASAYDTDIGDALGIHEFGLYQVELPAGCVTVAHDHATDGAEDAYAVIRGSGVVVVDGTEVSLASGEFIAVRPEAVRHVRAGPDGLAFIAVCAPAYPGTSRA